MKSRFLLNIVVRKGSSIFQLLTSKDKPLLIGRDTFLVLDLCLHIFDSIRSFNLKGNCLASKGLHKNLHTPTEPKNQVKSRFLLDIVVRKGSSIFQLLTSKDKPLLIGRDTFLILNFSLHIFNRVRSFNLKGNSLASKGLHKNLHTTTESKNQMKSRFLLDIVV